MLLCRRAVLRHPGRVPASTVPQPPCFLLAQHGGCRNQSGTTGGGTPERRPRWRIAVKTRTRAGLLTLAATGLLAAVAPAQNAAQTGPRPGIVRVRLDTIGGPILLALDARRAPATTANFMKYVDDGRFDGTTFYRAARGKADPTKGFIQAGIRTDAKRILPSFPFEPTSRTGIRHLDATISMARGDDPASAGGNFVLTVGPTPQMDARPGYKGYAAFGHVVGGMPLVKRILALPSGGGFDAMKGQMILRPIRIIRAVRLDGVARPTDGPKVWLLTPQRG